MGHQLVQRTESVAPVTATRMPHGTSLPMRNPALVPRQPLLTSGLLLCPLHPPAAGQSAQR
jgi:hypothetical protein